MPKKAPIPIYIFRGHTAQVNVLVFSCGDTTLYSGDADGQVLVWDLKTRRTTVKWKAHKDSVLSIQEWGANRLITHGRDNNIHVWDCTNLESLTSGNPLFSLPVNALNFCKFSTCSPENDDDDLLIAVPSILDSSMIDIFSLRHQTRLWAHIGLPPFPESSSPPSEQPAKAGLCMALRLFWRDKQLYLLAGYENGGLAFWRLQKGETIVEGEGTDARRVVVKDGVREKVWEVKEHKEVVLAIDVSPDMCHALSTSADDKIVKYSLYDNPSSNEIIAGSVTLKHPGVSDVRIRSDGRIFATGGWDGRIRVYSLKTLKPLAILAYHRESVYALAFAPVSNIQEEEEVAQDEMVEKHYVAGAGKDERISLWEVY